MIDCPLCCCSSLMWATDCWMDRLGSAHFGWYSVGVGNRCIPGGRFLCFSMENVCTNHTWCVKSKLSIAVYCLALNGWAFMRLLKKFQARQTDNNKLRHGRGALRTVYKPHKRSIFSCDQCWCCPDPYFYWDTLACEQHSICSCWREDLTVPLICCATGCTDNAHLHTTNAMPSIARQCYCLSVCLPLKLQKTITNCGIEYQSDWRKMWSVKTLPGFE